MQHYFLSYSNRVHFEQLRDLSSRSSHSGRKYEHAQDEVLGIFYEAKLHYFNCAFIVQVNTPHTSNFIRTAIITVYIQLKKLN